jgi:L-ascorbate metabolism protein UlaG (beta-lactamase superfamily)
MIVSSRIRSVLVLLSIAATGCGSSSSNSKTDASSSAGGSGGTAGGAGGSGGTGGGAGGSGGSGGTAGSGGSGGTAGSGGSGGTAGSGGSGGTGGMPAADARPGDGPKPDAAPAAGQDTFDTNLGPLKMTPIKHASVLFEWNNMVVYVDPAMGNFDGRPQADVILISHIHGDHFVPAIIQKVRKASTMLFGPANVAAMVTGMTTMANGDTKTVGMLEIHAIGAYNLTAGRLGNHPMGVGNGYVLKFGSKTVFVSGDTECVPDIKALTNVDVALLCMNLPYTMSPAEAAPCVKAFMPKVTYPYHYQNQAGDHDVSGFPALVGNASEVRLREWYP